jgi:chemotaxis protein methyltransferase CheR
LPVRDEDCVDFLQWALPKLDKRWPGFRKVRGQVCKRIDRRLAELGLTGGIDAYRDYLARHPDEWAVLDGFCRITISRFYRDRGVFKALAQHVLPDQIARLRERSGATLRIWSAGCASGEEPYTLRILWEQALARAHPDVRLRIVATDAQAHMLERARRACYPAGTLKHLPDAWRTAAFEPCGGEEDDYCLRPAYRTGITFRQQDLRTTMPDGPFALILCRNLAFTYFAEPLQRAVLDGLRARLTPGGILVLGKHEELPEGRGFEVVDEHRRLYRRADDV